ncbi:MAG: anthranilate phosphoribosyltransferase, partial [Pseudomonadota bacterium]
MSDFTPLLKAAVSGKPLPSEAMAEAMAALLDGAVSDVEAAAFLGALAARGETIEEISVAAEVMRSKALRVAAPAPRGDTRGTGGGRPGALKLSTAAAVMTGGGGGAVA